MEIGRAAPDGTYEPVDTAAPAASGAAGSTVAPAGQLADRLVAGFLLGYHDRTRTAYRADLRDFAAWCGSVGLDLLAAGRIQVEGYARHLEQAGRAHSTVAQRLATLAGFYRYAVQGKASPRSPAA